MHDYTRQRTPCILLNLNFFLTLRRKRGWEGGVRECEIIYLKFETTSQLASSTISYPGGSSPVFFRFSVVTFWMMALYLWNEQGIPPPLRDGY